MTRVYLVKFFLLEFCSARLSFSKWWKFHFRTKLFILVCCQSDEYALMDLYNSLLSASTSVIALPLSQGVNCGTTLHMLNSNPDSNFDK